MEKKTLDMHYTTIQKLQENDVLSHFLFSLEEKFNEWAGTGHKINCSIDIHGKKITALLDDNFTIIAKITDHNVRSVSLTKMPELMKIFESTKRELEEEYAVKKPEALSALEPIMYIHSRSVELVRTYYG